MTERTKPPCRRPVTVSCSDCLKEVTQIKGSVDRTTRKYGRFLCLVCIVNQKENRERHKNGLNKVLGTSEYSASLSAAQKRRFQRHGTEACKKAARALWHDPKNRESADLIRSGIKRRKNDPEWKAKDQELRGTDEFREKMSASMVEAFQDPQKKQRHAEAMASEEVRSKLSESSKRLWSDADFRKLMSDQRREMWQDPEYRNKTVLGIRESWTDERRSIHRELMNSDENRAKLRDVWGRDGYRDKRVRAIKELWSSPVYRENHLRAMNSDEVRAKMAKARQNIQPISSLNKTVFAILDSLGVEWVSEYAMGPWNFDVFVPSHKLLIECQGEYYHSFPKKEFSDLSKASYIENNFIDHKLVHIWELEFYSPGRVEKRLKGLLGIGDEDLKIKDVDFGGLKVSHVHRSKVAPIYNHHYLGSVRGHIHFGLAYREEIIGGCSFGHFQRNEQTTKYGKGALELTRFCIDPKFQVKNLGSWFLSRCLKAVQTTVVTYADSTYQHDGTLYRACNFRFSHEVARSYSYVDDKRWVYHKKTIWNRAKKMGMTENEYAGKHGLRKLWGSGKRCFVYGGD